MMLTKHNTIDIYEQDEWPAMLKGVLIYSENEYGCASHIAMKSLLGEQEPSGRILTHLINQMVFNQTKDFESVGWEYYFYNDYMIININKWPTTPIMPLHEAQATWIHCYPPVRDLLSFLKDKYYQSSATAPSMLAFVTSTTLHDSLNTDIFAIHSPEDMLMYQHKDCIKLNITDQQDPKPQLKTDLFFTPPAWLFPHLANAMGMNYPVTLFSGHDPESGDIDEVAALTLFRWLNRTTGNHTNKHAFNRSLKNTKREVAVALKMRNDLETMLKSNEESEAPNVLWG